MKKLALFLMILTIISTAIGVYGCSNEAIKMNNVSISEASFNGKTFPFINIDTSGGQDIISKEEYIPCVVSVTNTQEEYLVDNVNASIKGRGNSTWSMPKKPYKLKFESKTNLFGYGKAKKWVLLANYCDKSLSRNLIAYSVGEAIGLSETSSAQPVNLVVNGQYYGVYLLCEQNEIGKSRINIASDLQDIDTGYLIEIDSRASEEGKAGEAFFTIDGSNYLIKDPEPDDNEFTSQHFEFVYDYFEQCYQALNSNDYQRVKELIDTESFAKTYLVHELFNCIDVGFSSFYFYKVANEKLFAGPLWDFDISSGNCDYEQLGDIYNSTRYLYAKNSNVWYNKLLAFDGFKQLVGEQLAFYQQTIITKIQEVVSYQLEYKENNEANFEVWDILNRYVWPNPNEVVNIHSFEGQVEYLQNWLFSKLDYMGEVYL